EASSRSDDETEVAGLRAFAPGDAPRRVHWRASWRRRALLVRDAEGDVSGGAEGGVRTRGAAPRGGVGPAAERAASQAGACAGAYRGGAGFGGGRGGARPTAAAAPPPAAGTVHRARLLGYLALVQPESEASAEHHAPEVWRS